MNKVAAVFCVALCSGCANGSGSGPWSAFDNVDASSVDAPEEQILTTDSGAIIKPLSLEAGAFDLMAPGTYPIGYWGGPVMTQPINVYFIWYGAWTDKTVAPILEDFAKNIGSSDWFKISTTYFQETNYIQPVSDAGQGYFSTTHSSKPARTATWRRKPTVSDAGTIADASSDAMQDAGDAGQWAPGPKYYVSSQVNFVKSLYMSSDPNAGGFGTQLSDIDISSIVNAAVSNNNLTLDPNAVYFVLASAEVNETSGWCDQYCGWHNSVMIGNQDIKFAFVGDTGSCETCSLQDEYTSVGLKSSPNGNWSADTMVSVIAHELSEAATDPDPIGGTVFAPVVSWQTSYGQEIADLCAWVFNQPYLTATGSVANMKVGSRDYMIQANWVRDDVYGNGHCGLNP